MSDEFSCRVLKRLDERDSGARPPALDPPPARGEPASRLARARLAPALLRACRPGTKAAERREPRHDGDSSREP